MKHARPDYNRIQDPAGLIPQDEPVFLLRGQDALAPQVVRFYAEKAFAAGLHEVANASFGQVSEMLAWQAGQKVKMPDISEPVTLDMATETKRGGEIKHPGGRANYLYSHGLLGHPHILIRDQATTEVDLNVGFTVMNGSVVFHFSEGSPAANYVWMASI